MVLTRPLPPEDMREEGHTFQPGRDLYRFVRSAFIEPGAPFWREEYAPLLPARIGVLWTNVRKEKAMVQWAASAEVVTTGGDKWTKGRALQQLAEWFMGWFDDLPGSQGEDLPDFVLTFYGPEMMKCNDVGFCAYIAHELRHCAQKEKDGGPLFDDDDRPQWAIRDHDVTAWLSVAEDFGPVERNVPELVAALAKEPRFPGAEVSGICGTCERSPL